GVGRALRNAGPGLGVLEAPEVVAFVKRADRLAIHVDTQTSHAEPSEDLRDPFGLAPSTEDRAARKACSSSEASWGMSTLREIPSSRRSRSIRPNCTVGLPFSTSTANCLLTPTALARS